MSACGAKDGVENGVDLQPEFLTPVAAAQQASVGLRWLGKDLHIEGMHFSVGAAKFPEGFLGVPLKGVEIYYLQEPQQSGTSFELNVFPPSEWAKVRQKVQELRISGEPRPATRRSVKVGTQDAELLLLPLGTREINHLWLIVELEDAVVVARAHSGGPRYPGGPDYNPFINNPDLLVQVIDENLRPYPE